MALAYVCVRPQRAAARAEHASFCAQTGLAPDLLSVVDLTRAPLPPDAFDRFTGFLVGGSPFNVTDAEHAKSDLQRRVEADLRAIAACAIDTAAAALFTCYGIGVVARMLGGTVSRDFPDPTGAAVVRLTDAGRADAVTRVAAPSFLALSAHKEGSGQTPPGAVLLAIGEHCPVQAYRVGERLWATQFHPEATPGPFTQRMAFYRDGGYFDPAEFDRLADAVRASEITEPGRMLRAFAALFA